MDEHTLYAARDRHGVRPLVLGKLETGWVVASESAGLDIVGASFVREIEPGEFISIDANGVRSQRWAEAQPKGCLFEYVYLLDLTQLLLVAEFIKHELQLVHNLQRNILQRLILLFRSLNLEHLLRSVMQKSLEFLLEWD